MDTIEKAGRGGRSRSHPGRPGAWAGARRRDREPRQQRKIVCLNVCPFAARPRPCGGTACPGAGVLCPSYQVNLSNT
ncbi:MAG: hypothetical protein MZV64_04545 [Ignavibacteriales bacterium]|nr:hypothetical protein [Ignavibacteriales bacterium]